MIRVAIDIDERFSLLVYAENLVQAVALAKRQYPDQLVQVRFPLDPDTFFDSTPSVAESEMVMLHDEASASSGEGLELRSVAQGR